MTTLELATKIVAGEIEFHNRTDQEKLALLGLIGNCPHCSSFHFLDVSSNVQLGESDPDIYYEEGDQEPMASQTWCEDCVENYAFRWYDGLFHDAPQMTQERDIGTEIPSYHSMKVFIERSRLHRADMLGIELETYQPKVHEAAVFFKKIRSKTKQGFKYERDGSLDRSFGVEVAAQPYSLQEIRDGIAPWKEVLQWSYENDARGWDAGDGYGMHVSLNGNAINPLHRSRIVRFIMDNKDLCCSIAGREESSYAKFGKLDNLKDEFKRTDKYYAAAIRAPRIEVRIFRSTLRWERFLSNCEFVDAVRVYTEESGFSNKSLRAEPFKDWICRGDNAAMYPNLAVNLGVSRKKEEKEVNGKKVWVPRTIACAD